MNSDPRLLDSLLQALKINTDWFGDKEIESLGLTPFLLEIASQGFAEREKRGFRLKKGARALLSQLAVRLGASPSRASQHLRPSEFEDFVYSALRTKGFSARRRVRVKTPEGISEFDVIGIHYRMAIFVECKKWRRKGPLGSVCRQHTERVRAFGYAALSRIVPKRTLKLIGFPAVVTLIPDVQIVEANCLAIGIDRFGMALERIETGEFDSMALEFPEEKGAQ